MKTAQLFVSFVFALVMLLGFAQLGQVHAGQLTNLKMTMTSSVPSASTTHTFQFTHPSNATLRQVNFQYCQDPSGSCVAPNGLDASSALKGSLTGLTAAQWSLNNASTDTPKLVHVGSGETVNDGTVMNLPITTITNNVIDAGTPSNNCDGNDGDLSTDTCYIIVTSYSDLGTTAVDSGVTSYTVVASVTVRARVDPLFTFSVGGTSAGAVYSAITTSVATTYNNLNFGNLTANTPKYAAHSLTVTTNTENGYTITQRMSSPLTGVYTSNNIDPFVASWGTPTTWTQPTGTTPNVDTGWIGANTTDTGVAGWGSPSQKFGPVSSSNNVVMTESDSDSGAVSTYVTYGIEANVFQPADTYTGTLIYTAIPTY
jgi:hypothetical protein